MLLSGSCHGLQKMVDVCSGYGDRLDIHFNTSKSQTAVFGECCTPNFTLTLNDLAIPVVSNSHTTFAYLRTTSFQNSSCDPNQWLIVDLCHQRHDFQLKMHHKWLGFVSPNPVLPELLNLMFYLFFKNRAVNDVTS